MKNSPKFMAGVLLALAIVAATGCAGQTVRTVSAGDNVTVDYTAWLDDGTIFGTTNGTVALDAGIYSPSEEYSPISFIVGANETIDGFDQAVRSLKVGESCNVTLTPAEAYGDYDPSRIQPVPMETLAASNITPYVNQTLWDSYGQPLRVDSIPDNTTVYIDYNHPLAGKTLHFQITVRDIQAVNTT